MVEGITLVLTLQSHLDSYCNLRQFSCAGTPKQNIVVEREHRYIIETGLTLLFYANAPHYLQVDAFATIVFLTNRMLSTVLQNVKSRFQRLFHINPITISLKYLDVFVFLVYDLKP